jgi:flagellin-like hook-associated protein FlgL
MIIQPNLLTAMRVTTKAIDLSTERISTGQKVNRAGDDPLAFSSITNTKTSISTAGISLSTLDYALNRNDGRDQLMASMQDSMMRFNELTTMASGGFNKLTDIIPEMTSIEQAMVAMGNTTDASGQMFSGNSAVVPFVQNPATSVVTYAGSAVDQTMTVEGITLSGNIAGTPLMQAFNAMRTVLASMTAGTAPSAAMVQSVHDAVSTLVDIRTQGAAQASSATTIQTALTSRQDNEKSSVSRMQDADMTAETIKMSEGQKQYEAIMKVTGMRLSQHRLMDFI